MLEFASGWPWVGSGWPGDVFGGLELSLAVSGLSSVDSILFPVAQQNIYLLVIHQPFIAKVKYFSAGTTCSLFKLSRLVQM